jgi:hypothetical protein
MPAPTPGTLFYMPEHFVLRLTQRDHLVRVLVEEIGQRTKTDIIFKAGGWKRKSESFNPRPGP